MEFEFANRDLEEVYYNPKASLGHGSLVDKGFRKLIGKIYAAKDEFDLRALKSLHYHKLEGNRNQQHALDITPQWRLIVNRVEVGERTKIIAISVEDYH